MLFQQAINRYNNQQGGYQPRPYVPRTEGTPADGADNAAVSAEGEQQAPQQNGYSSAKSATQGALQGKHLSVGVLLPLHNNDGDGRRMTEYYRGLLMACDSLRAEGLSVDIHAWNVNIDSDITQFMPSLAGARCDVVFGPLYSKQVRGLAEFCKARDIKMVITMLHHIVLRRI